MSEVSNIHETAEKTRSIDADQPIYFVEVCCHVYGVREEKILEDVDDWIKNQHEDADLYQSAFLFYAGDCHDDSISFDIESEPIVGNLFFDLDYEDDPEKARLEAVRLVKRLHEYYDISMKAIDIYFSGNKGFHISVNLEVFNIKPYEHLHEVFKAMAEEIANPLFAKINDSIKRFETIDLRVYNRRRIWRIPNTRHQKSGLYKIPLTFVELNNMKIDEIKGLAESPRHVIKSEFGKMYSEKAERWFYAFLEKNEREHIKKKHIEWLRKNFPKMYVTLDKSKREKRYLPRREVVEELYANNRFYLVNDEFWRYDKDTGLWVPDGKKFIEKACTKLIPECNQHDRNEVIHMMNTIISKLSKKDKTPLETGDYSGYEKTIALKDEVFNIEFGYWEEHSYKFYHIKALPWSRDPLRRWLYKNPDEKGEKYPKCPMIDAFLREVLETSEDVDAFYEMAGYCLLRDYPFAKAFMFSGTGANGKSTMLNMLRIFLGVKNVSSMTLHQISTNRFVIADLRNKYANISSELDYKALKDTSTFKALTGGDFIKAERKYGHPFDFKNTAKLIFMCNKIPQVKYDDTVAFWRRWILFKCPNVFIGDNCDPSILKKLTTEFEMNGFLMKSIEGLKRLMKNGRFSNEKSHEETEKIYVKRSDTVWFFVDYSGKVIKDMRAFVPKSELYKHYKKFCANDEIKLPPVSMNVFSRNLKRHADIIEERIMLEKKQVRCWVGITLNDKQKYLKEDGSSGTK